MSIEGARMTTSTAEKNPTETPPSGEYPAQPLITQEEPRLTQGTWIGMIVVAAIVAGVVIFGVMARRGSEHSLAKETAAAKKAAVDASMANVRRLEQLQSFEKVYAPFDGIVTARNTDVGRLISAGQNTTPQELFHLAAIGKIRVYVAVPQAYSAAVKDGGKATLTLDEYPGRSFEGTIARN